MAEPKKSEKEPEPVQVIEGAVIDRIEVTASRKIGLPDYGSLGKTVTIGAQVVQGADPTFVIMGLHALANEWVEGLAQSQADLVLETLETSVPVAKPAPVAQPAQQPAEPAPTTEEGEAYRDLKVTPTCYLQRVVTNNGTHKCNALVKPLTVHGIDAWEEPLDACAATADWRDWAIGSKVLLAPLGIKTVRVLCKPDGRTPIKVYAFLKE